MAAIGPKAPWTLDDIIFYSGPASDKKNNREVSVSRSSERKYSGAHECPGYVPPLAIQVTSHSSGIAETAPLPADKERNSQSPHSSTSNSTGSHPPAALTTSDFESIYADSPTTTLFSVPHGLQRSNSPSETSRSTSTVDSLGLRQASPAPSDAPRFHFRASSTETLSKDSAQFTSIATAHLPPNQRQWPQGSLESTPVGESGQILGVCNDETQGDKSLQQAEGQECLVTTNHAFPFASDDFDDGDDDDDDVPFIPQRRKAALSKPFHVDPCPNSRSILPPIVPPIDRVTAPEKLAPEHGGSQSALDLPSATSEPTHLTAPQIKVRNCATSSRPRPTRRTFVPERQPTWEVDRIVKSTRKQGKRLYLVRWKDTWEPASSLLGCADTALAEYHSTR